MDEKTINLATAARRACEAFYAKLERRRIPHGFNEHLEGMCAIASNFLSSLYSRHGIHSIVVGGYFRGLKHCWLELEDGTIVDITATQFRCDRYPKVFVIQISQEETEKYVRDPEVEDFSTWIDHQRPSYNFNREIIRHLPKPRRPKITVTPDHSLATAAA